MPENLEPAKAAEKCIKNPMQIKQWENSQAYFYYLGFIEAVNESVKSTDQKSHPKDPSTSDVIPKVLNLLDSLQADVQKFPPQTQPQRFGNKSYRDWSTNLSQLSFNDRCCYNHDPSFNKLSVINRAGANFGHRLSYTCLRLDADTKALLPAELESYWIELKAYLSDSFGNSTRIDYGTGHEAAFVMFLVCLARLDLLKPNDHIYIVTQIMTKYLSLVRELHRVYMMEPAGSHGSWSLDDFQFIPFIWGSAQLIGHPKIEPSSYPNKDIAETYKDEYMFMSAIQTINSVKSGPFAEHSAQLWNISGVPAWPKVNSGLIKMYRAEVLAKFPVIQHFLFGSLLPFKPKD